MIMVYLLFAMSIFMIRILAGYGYIIVIFIELIDIFIYNNTVWQQFHVLRVAEDVDPYDSKFIYKSIDATAFWTDPNRNNVGDDLPGVPANSAQTGRRGRRPLRCEIKSAAFCLCRSL